VDVGAARECPGVEAILTSEAVVGRTEPITVLRPFAGSARTPFYAMAFPVARYEGEPVVAVAARDRYVAEDAAECVEIDWEPLPHVVDVQAARSCVGDPPCIWLSSLALPSGVRITELELEACDGDSVSKISFGLNRHPLEHQARFFRQES